MEFTCNFNEVDYTRMIGNALKLETIKMILTIEEIADIEKVLILKELLHVEAPRTDGTVPDDYEDDLR